MKKGYTQNILGSELIHITILYGTRYYIPRRIIVISYFERFKSNTPLIVASEENSVFVALNLKKNIFYPSFFHLFRRNLSYF